VMFHGFNIFETFSERATQTRAVAKIADNWHLTIERKKCGETPVANSEQLPHNCYGP